MNLTGRFSQNESKTDYRRLGQLRRIYLDTQKKGGMFELGAFKHA